MGHEGPGIHAPAGHYVEDGFEVPLLGPANETYRVVDPLLFVRRIVTAGTVRAGYLEAELLLVEVRPRQLEAGHADEHDAPAPPAHQRPLVHRLVAAGGGRDQHAIYAAPARERRGRRQGILAGGQVHDVGAELPRQRQLAGIVVDPQHAAPVGAQQLHRHQADQAEPRHDEALAQGRLRQPDALETDRADHGERRFFVADRIGDLAAQVLRNVHHFRVSAVRHDALPYREAGDVLAHVHDDADIAVPERQRLVQLAEDGLEGGNEAVGPDLVPHLPDPVRLGTRFPQQRRLPEADEHAFGTGRHERRRGADQKMAALDPRARNLGHFRSPRPEVLQDLLHGCSTGAGARRRIRSSFSAGPR